MTDQPPTVSPARSRLLDMHARATPARERVLDILLAGPRALSHQEIEAAARERGLDFDRVTLYRVLDWLVTQRLAHKIEGRDRVWRFNAVTVTEAEHGHAHFHCTRCGKVFCLEQMQPSFALTFACARLILFPQQRADAMDVARHHRPRHIALEARDAMIRTDVKSMYL
jgi:Fur family transcriptional regulator, ferric uptake regulator